MQPDRYTTTPATAARAAVDAGLRSFLQRVYNRMVLGVLVTAITAFAVSSSPELMKLFMGGPQAYVIMLAPLAVVWFGFNPMTMSSSKLSISFFVLSVLYGLSFSLIFMVYTNTDIARAFFITTAMFAGLSIFGYTTKKDLTGIGTFCVMGTIGLVILSVINMFMQGNTMLSNVISAAAILIFSGVTAWQTQAMKEMYSATNSDESNSRLAWSAALTLYISFIALFQHILHFLGNNR